MEYHNYNTPLDRIDEDFVKKILSGEYEPSFGRERAVGNRKQDNNDCGCDSRTGAAKTCRYNRRYTRCNSSRSAVNNCGTCKRETVSSCERSDCRHKDESCGCNGSNARREERPHENDPCTNGKPETVCGCGECVSFTPPELQGVPLSMVYSPYQHFEGLYECDEALDRGTIFRCLDFPFIPTPCNCLRRNEENKGCR